MKHTPQECHPPEGYRDDVSDSEGSRLPYEEILTCTCMQVQVSPLRDSE